MVTMGSKYQFHHFSWFWWFSSFGLISYNPPESHGILPNCNCRKALLHILALKLVRLPCLWPWCWGHQKVIVSRILPKVWLVLTSIYNPNQCYQTESVETISHVFIQVQRPFFWILLSHNLCLCRMNGSRCYGIFHDLVIIVIFM